MGVGHGELEARVERGGERGDRRILAGVVVGLATQLEGRPLGETSNDLCDCREDEEPCDPRRHGRRAYSLRVPVVNFHDRLVIVPWMTAVMSTR